MAVRINKTFSEVLLETSANNLPLRQIPYFFAIIPLKKKCILFEVRSHPYWKTKIWIESSFFSPRCTCLEVCECRMVCPQTRKTLGFHASL